MGGIWIFAEQRQGRVQRIAFELLTRARELAVKAKSDVSAVVLGHNVDQQDMKELISCGASQIIYVDDPALRDFLVEPYATVLVDLIERYCPEIFLAGATTTGRTLMPYTAIKANTGLTADCTQLDIESETGHLLQTRPAIGGNIMATIKTPNHRPQMATVRPRSTQPAPAIGHTDGQLVRLAPVSELIGRLTLRHFKRNEQDVPLSDADVVITVGRGIKKKENLDMIYELAHLMNAAVGATRDVVDRGWLSYPHQVGLSGQTISPKLYIGIGLSGTIQHIAGMQTAESIVAINSDPEAQIFKIADYGIAGDLFEVVPVLIERLKKVPLDDNLDTL